LTGKLKIDIPAKGREMSYELAIRHETDYMYVKATGIRTVEDLLAIAKDCKAACDEHGYKKLLINVQGMTGRLSTVESFTLGREEMGKLEGRGLYTTAIVDLEENRDRFKFLEDVLRNSGFNFRFFSNEADARMWLAGSEGVSGKPHG
jgi:hypothetical protein